MADATLRDNTTSQATIDYQIKRLILKNIETVREDYANISGALESVSVGTLIGKVAATGKVVPHDSTAVDGSQVPIGIMLDNLEDIAIAGTVDGVLIARGGDVDSSLIVFANGTDTLATKCTSTGGDILTIKDWLLARTKLIPITVEDSSYFDN